MAGRVGRDLFGEQYLRHFAEVGVRVDDPKIAQKLRGILELQLKDTVNARIMQPDGSYTKAHPGEGEAPVDSQMAMYAYFQDDFAVQPAAPKPAPAAPKPAAKPAAPSRPAAKRSQLSSVSQPRVGS